jgi:hypothetical protein
VHCVKAIWKIPNTIFDFFFSYSHNASQECRRRQYNFTIWLTKWNIACINTVEATNWTLHKFWTFLAWTLCPAREFCTKTKPSLQILRVFQNKKGTFIPPLHPISFHFFFFSTSLYFFMCFIW